MPRFDSPPIYTPSRWCWRRSIMITWVFTGSLLRVSSLEHAITGGKTAHGSSEEWRADRRAIEARHQGSHLVLTSCFFVGFIEFGTPLCPHHLYAQTAPVLSSSLDDN